MDVKDVRSSQDSKIVPAADLNPVKNIKSTVVSTANLISETVSKNPQAVNVDTRPRATIKAETRIKLNEMINFGNVASEATSQIEKLVKSIDGIAEQAQAPEVSDQRRRILEQEANELVDEIKRTASSPSLSGLRPLSGEKIRFEVEERIGRTLEIILPDDATKAFGLGKLTFSKKDTIISTIANIEAAEQSIQRLKQAVDAATKSINETTASVEVALQNSEAAESSVRDLDTAIKLAVETGSDISRDPERALKSVGDLKSIPAGLLE